MRDFNLLVVSVMVAATLILGAGLARAEEVPAVGFPVPKTLQPPDKLTFSHQLHVDENGLDCTDCHESVTESASIETSSTPEMDVCEVCHEDEVGENCSMCHAAGEDGEATIKSWVTEVRFSHVAHIGRKTECIACHAEAQTSEDSADRLTPAMKTCATCHQKQMDRLDCAGCHTDLASLKRSSSEVAVHKANWFPLHPLWAKGSAQVCSQCHQQSFCAECHEKTGGARASEILPGSTDRTLVHRGDWIGRHAMEASSNPATCLSCHGSSVCAECHEKALGLKHGKGDFRRSPHPVGYLNRGNAAGFHGTEVRREAWKCASCHDNGAASICVNCHKVGGPGGTPHPPGFERESGYDEDDQSKRISGTCLPCHG